MRIAVDTNVIVRYLVEDDAEQTAIAAETLDAADSIHLSTVVLCETVWVLRRVYGIEPGAIAETLRGLFEVARIDVDRPVADAGLRMLESGGDFADGVIAHEARRAACDTLVSFDTAFAARAGEIVSLLKPNHERSRGEST